MFEHARAENVSLSDPPTTNIATAKLVNELEANPTEAAQIIVYVHGLNNKESGYESFSQTLFKRLYWQGYHGRFAAFRWPSPTWSVFPLTEAQINPLNYNKGEYIGWKCAAALKDFLDNLSRRFPNHTINVVSFSAGGVVVDEAIRLGGHVDNFVMSQHTFPAEAYDGNNTNLIYSDLAGGAASPDEDSQGGYKNRFNDSTRRVNFYNDDDFACYQALLHGWEFIQKAYRPDHSLYLPGWDYYFDGTNCFFEFTDSDGRPTPLGTRVLSQDYEKKSYVARSRTKAIGAAGLKYPPYALAHGSIQTNISLQDASLGFTGGAAFGRSHDDHGGQIYKPIQDAIPYFRILLDTGFDIHPRL